MVAYWPAVLLSLAMHSVLIAFLAFGWEFLPKKTITPRPNFIKASLVAIEQTSQPKVTEKPKVAEPKAAPPPPQRIDLTKQRQEQERLKKLAADKKRKDELAKQQAEKVAQQEKEKQARIAREKAEKLAAQKAAEEKAEQERIAQQQAEAEEQARKEEQERLRQEREREIVQERERERLRQEQQQALLDDLSRERAELDAQLAAERQARQAAEDEVAKQSFSALIQKRVTDAWSRPPSARNNMIVELTIELIPTGEVINVNVTNSSNNSAFDRSAVRAVNRVGEFPEIREMPRRLFDAEFRSFKLNFSPEDLRQ